MFILVKYPVANPLALLCNGLVQTVCKQPHTTFCTAKGCKHALSIFILKLLQTLSLILIYTTKGCKHLLKLSFVLLQSFGKQLL